MKSTVVGTAGLYVNIVAAAAFTIVEFNRFELLAVCFSYNVGWWNAVDLHCHGWLLRSSGDARSGGDDLT